MKLPSRLTRFVAFCGLLAAAGCGTLAPPKPEPPRAPAPPTAARQPPAVTPAKPAPEPVSRAAALAPVTWDALPEWREEDPLLAWDAFLTSCSALQKRQYWREVCDAARSLPELDRDIVRRFFELNFVPHQVVNGDGGDQGLITGYYEPLLTGSRRRSAHYRYPIYGVPEDLLVIDLGELYPQLKNMRLRGRVEGRRVVPYFSRAQIEQGLAPLAGKEIAWVDDAIDLFFLQIQGSGRVQLESGEVIRVGYADQNGHPYRSIGRLLVERGELPLEKASMQGIKSWAKQHPDRLSDLLYENASYVFFRELPGDLPGPLGALGVPLTARRSLAVDPRYVPLGAPVYLSTTWPNSTRPLNRLMLAQDTGGVIRGPVRADFFWGFGEEAGREAGRMRQRGRMWVLLPNGFPLDGENAGN